MNWQDYFTLDAECSTGLRWRKDLMGVRYPDAPHPRAGNIAGWTNVHGYYGVTLLGKSYLVHRIIFEMHHNEVLGEGDFIDHKDRDRQNNSISNLRVVGRVYNQRNLSIYKCNTSGITGVSLIKGAWVAQCKDSEGKSVSKSFSCNKYGQKEAFELACNFRIDFLAKRNLEGAGYTESHGE